MRSAFEETRKNKRRTFLLFVLFFLIIFPLSYLVGYLFGDPFMGLILATVFGIIYVPIALNSGSSMVLESVGAKPVTKKEYPHLYHTVEGLSVAAGIKNVPKCYVMNDSALNAFATGKDREHGIVCVTTGLLDKLNREEVEGVVAHEMSHISNEDIKVMTIATVTVGLISLLAEIFLRSLWFRSGDDDNANNAIFIVIGIALAILAPICAQLVKLAVSRRREYMADDGSVILTRNPGGLKSALEKISKNAYVKKAPGTTAHLFISSPSKPGLLEKLFSTHPPINERIERLKEM